MIRGILAVFGLGIRYRDERGVYTHRYNGLDFNMSRPIHATMFVAMPWAKCEIYRISAL